MTVQQAWDITLMSTLKDPQSWAALQNNTMQDGVRNVLEVFGKMYQQQGSPYEVIGQVAIEMSKDVSTLDLTKVSKKQGKDFVLAVVDMVQQHFEDIVSEIKSAKKEIKK